MNVYTLNRGIHRRLYEYYRYQSRKKLYHDKINQLVSKFQAKNLSKAQISEIKNYYSSFGFQNIKTSWHELCTHIRGKFHRQYIPEDLFYNFIEPGLNMFDMHPGLTDKNLLNRLFKGVKQPEIIAKNVNGFYLDSSDDSLVELDEVIKNCLNYSKIVIKPSIDSGGGRNVFVINLEEGDSISNIANIKEALKFFDKNFSIQHFIKQHKQIDLLNATSLNTIRVMSLLIKNEVKILTCILRIGSEGSNVDNISKGGVACSIDLNGQLSEKGYLFSTKSVMETSSGIKLEGFKVPGFNKLNETIQNLHFQIPYFKLISWDIAINVNGELVLVEYNVRSQEILGVQLINGPLFGDCTDMVLSSLNMS